jgi:DNA-binding CsgD family transcriptional regulator
MTPHKLQVARDMYASGQYTVAAIATTLGVSRASIYRHLSNADRRLGSSAHGAVLTAEPTA